jgi:molybdopterin converting factor small subunit
MGKHECRRGLALHRTPLANGLFRHLFSLSGTSAMGCTVRIPSPLRSYTNGAASTTADGSTVAEVLLDLDRRFPGMRFRIRMQRPSSRSLCAQAMRFT